MGIPRRRLSNMLSGTLSIGPDVAEKIAAHLGTNAADYLAQQQAFKDFKKKQPRVKFKSIDKQKYYDSWKHLEIKKDE